MQDLKKGDVIVANDNGASHREELARLEDLVFTRQLFSDKSVGSPLGPQLIEDLVTFGFEKEVI